MQSQDKTPARTQPVDGCVQRWLWPFAGFAALYCLVVFWGLGRFPFIGPDEPRYAQVAREMFASGDYISPRLCGLLWFEKPALFYWAAAASYHVFGASEFAARFPSALAAIATAAFVGYALWRSQSPRLGLIGAAVLGTSITWLGFANAATTDMMLSATIAIALLAAYLATASDGRARLGFLLLSAAFTGLAMIAKGLIGVFLVVAVLSIHSLLTRRFLFRNWREAAGALAVFAVVASTWYLPVTLANGRVFIDEFFINHHFKRYLTNKYQHPQPAYFYLMIVAGGGLPWSFFLIPAVARLKYLRPREGARDSLLALAWAWLLVTVGFFSFSTSKLPGYILPVFPALAIILSMEAERVWIGERGKLLRAATFLNAFALVLLSVAALVYLRRKQITLPTAEMALCALPATLGALAFGAILSNRPRLVIATPALAMLGVGVTATLLLSKIGDTLGNKSYSMQVAQALRPREDILFYRKEKAYSHVFYSNGRVVFYNGGRPIEGMSTGDDLDIDSRDELLQALAWEMSEGEPSAILVTTKAQEEALRSDPSLQAEVVAREDDSVALRVRLQPRVGALNTRRAPSRKG